MLRHALAGAGIMGGKWKGVALRRGKSVGKDTPRVETFSDFTVCSSAAAFAMRTRSGILRPNRSARRRSVRVMRATFSPLIREPWNQIDITDWQTRLHHYASATFAA